MRTCLFDGLNSPEIPDSSIISYRAKILFDGCLMNASVCPYAKHI